MTNTLRRHLRTERGFALVPALLVMMVCLTAGFAIMTMVDAGQSSSRRERSSESTFSLAEGVLNSQIFLLSKQWPANTGAGFAYPSSCTPSSTSGLCPDGAALQHNYPGVDYAAGIDWSTEVHDNTTTTGSGGATYDATQFYDDAVVRQQPTWDSNHDGLMWVRAQAVVRGERRTLIALVKAEKLDTPFPRNAIVANQLTVGPNGNQNYVNTGGSYVTLRCDGGTMPESECRGWTNPVNVGPNATPNIDPAARPALTPETLDRMRDYAKANGTYFTGTDGCPESLTGDVVFIETASCSYQGNGTYNSPTQPGVLVIGSGSITFKGTSTYYGVVYNANGSGGTGTPSSDYVVTVQGNGCIQGSVVIDGGGGLKVGASHGANKCNGNIAYDPNAATHVLAYGTAGIVQNSFREISAGP